MTRAGATMRILVIDDEPVGRKAICAVVRLAGHACRDVRNVLAGIECVEQGAFDLVLFDLDMPGVRGLEALKSIARIGRRVPVVAMCRARDGINFQILALRLAGIAFLQKPFSSAALIEMLRQQARIQEPSRGS
jgi:two-component system response regulator FlrC